MERQIAGIIADHLRATTGRSPSESERKSWRRSLPILAHDLVEAGLGEIEMLIEYQLPLTSKLADVVLAGVDRRTGGDAYVVVELKQWSQAELYKASIAGRVEGMHRVWSIRCSRCKAIAITLPISWLPCTGTITRYAASLSSTMRPILMSTTSSNSQDRKNQSLYQEQTRRLSRISARSVRAGPGAGAADRLLTSAVRPSKQLLKLAAAEIKDREQFILLAVQRLAYEIVLHVVGKAQRSDAKEVVIVTVVR